MLDLVSFVKLGHCRKSDNLYKRQIYHPILWQKYLSGPYPTSLSGNKYIIAFVDWFSGWPEAYAVPDKIAETVAHLLLEEIFPRHGSYLQIVTDNGTENVNSVEKETLESLNIDHVLTSVNHPQSNAKVERFHRTLHDVLAKRMADDQQTWDLHLNQALAAISLM